MTEPQGESGQRGSIDRHPRVDESIFKNLSSPDLQYVDDKIQQVPGREPSPFVHSDGQQVENDEGHHPSQDEDIAKQGGLPPWGRGKLFHGQCCIIILYGRQGQE